MSTIIHKTAISIPAIRVLHSNVLSISIVINFMCVMFKNINFVKRNCTDTSSSCLKVLCLALVLECGSLIRQTGSIDKNDENQKNFIRIIALQFKVVKITYPAKEHAAVLHM